MGSVCISWTFLTNLLCLAQSLQSLADLRSTPHFPFSGEVDLAVGAAVESMGPEVVLGAVPLNITGVESVPTASARTVETLLPQWSD